MYQFFVEDAQISATDVVIEGSDVNHIKNVLRMKCGEKIRISSATGRNFFCSVAEISGDLVRAEILEELEDNTELPNKIYLFQGLPKSDKMELIIQKAVELGVYEIIPVAMKNCVVKLDDKKAGNKVKRWQAISESAAKQSKRTLIPEVQMPMTWKEAMKKAEELDVVLVPYECERGMETTREVIKTIQPGQNIAIFIGPEGGFSPEEIEGICPTNAGEGFSQILAEKAYRISLGRRILRTETAGLATLSMLIFCLDE